MSYFTHIPVASYVCNKTCRNTGSYKLMRYLTRPQANGRRVMPDTQMLSYLSYSEDVSNELAIERLKRMSLNSKTDTIHVYDNHVFNAEDIKLSFGKYKGLLLEEVYLSDPSYVRWLASTIKPTSFINRCIQLQCQKWSASDRVDPIICSRNTIPTINI